MLNRPLMISAFNRQRIYRVTWEASTLPAQENRCSGVQHDVTLNSAEECLTLNLIRPSRKPHHAQDGGSLLPVVAHIHREAISASYPYTT